MFSGEPEPPSLIPIISCFSISGAPDTRVTKEFGIFSESTRSNDIESIAQENHCQLLDSPETDPVWYISLIIQGYKDCLGDIHLMYCILRHSSPIPGLPEEYSHLFARPGIKFRNNSDPLSCQV